MSGDFDTVLSVLGGEIDQLLEDFGHIDLDIHQGLTAIGDGTNIHLKDVTQNNGDIKLNIMYSKVDMLLKNRALS